MPACGRSSVPHSVRANCSHTILNFVALPGRSVRTSDEARSQSLLLTTLSQLGRIWMEALQNGPRSIQRMDILDWLSRCTLDGLGEGMPYGPLTPHIWVTQHPFQSHSTSTVEHWTMLSIP